MSYDENWREVVGKEKADEKAVNFNEILNSCIKPCLIVFTLVIGILFAVFKVYEFRELVIKFLLEVHSCFVFSIGNFYIPIVVNAIFVFIAILCICIRSNYYERFSKAEKIRFNFSFSVILFLNALIQYSLFSSFWDEESREFMSDIMIGVSNISHFSTWAACGFFVIYVLVILIKILDNN
jgi:hypothetical protein